MTLIAALVGYLILTIKRPLVGSIGRLLAAEWVILLTLYLIFESEFVPLSTESVLYITVFFVCFFLAYEVGLTIRLPPVAPPFVVRGSYIMLFALVAGSVSIALGVHHALTLGITSAMEYRYLYDAELAGAPAISNRIGISFPLACAAWMLARSNNQRALSGMFAVLALVLAVLSTSKIFILLWLLYSVPHIGMQGPRTRTILITAGVGLAAFAFMHLVLGKVLGDVSDGIIEGLLLTLKTYLLGGLAGMQLVVSGEAVFPENAMWKALGDLLPGSIRVPESAILPWIQTGVWHGNAYSAFSYWVDAFGWLSSIGIGLVLGTAYGAVQSASSSLAMSYFRTFAIFPLLFLFHQDFFVPSVFMWIAFTLSTVLLWLTKNRKQAT
jgi:hypothetical protein